MYVQAMSDSEAVSSSTAFTPCSVNNNQCSVIHNLSNDFNFKSPARVTLLYTRSGSISKKVWLDANQNGVFDSYEQPFEGISAALYYEDGTVVVDNNTGKALTTKTDKNGEYSFTELTPSAWNSSGQKRYYVKFAIPDGYAVSSSSLTTGIVSTTNAKGITQLLTVTPGEMNSTANMGLYRAPSAPSTPSTPSNSHTKTVQTGSKHSAQKLASTGSSVAIIGLLVLLLVFAGIVAHRWVLRTRKYTDKR